MYYFFLCTLLFSFFGSSAMEELPDMVVLQIGPQIAQQHFFDNKHLTHSQLLIIKRMLLLIGGEKGLRALLDTSKYKHQTYLKEQREALQFAKQLRKRARILAQLQQFKDDLDALDHDDEPPSPLGLKIGGKQVSFCEMVETREFHREPHEVAMMFHRASTDARPVKKRSSKEKEPEE